MHQHALEGAIKVVFLSIPINFNSLFAHTLLIFSYRHKTKEAREVCTSIKFLMLHVRDCPGTTSTYDICPYPWCRKTKHLLYHLVSCLEPDKCKICTPEHLTPQMKQLKGLNQFRRKKQQERMKSSAAVSSVSTKTSTKLTNATAVSNRINQGLRKKTPLNPTVQKLKGDLGQTPALSIPKVSHINKSTPLSVPSPIPTGLNVTKTKESGVVLNVGPEVIAHNLSRQPNRGHLKIAAPANPLLPTASTATPKTQNPIKSSVAPPTANPLSKQNTHPLNIPSSNNSTRILNSNSVASATITHKQKLPPTITGSNQSLQTGEKNGPLFLNKTTGVTPNQKAPLNKNIPTMTSSVKEMVENNETKKKDFVTPNGISAISPVDSNASQQMTQQKPMERTKSETLLQVGY